MQPDFVEQRKAICRTCPANTKLMGLRFCGEILTGRIEGRTDIKGCGCTLMLITRIPSKVCPLGKWGRAVKDKDAAKPVAQERKEDSNGNP